MEGREQIRLEERREMAGWVGIYDWVEKYGLLMDQIVLGTKLVVSDRVRPISRVGSGSTLWVEIQTQALPYASCRIDPDPIGRRLDWVRVGFFSYRA